MLNAWMIRAGRGGYVIEDFEKQWTKLNLKAQQHQ